MFNGLTNYRVWGLALCYAYRWASCNCCMVLPGSGPHLDLLIGECALVSSSSQARFS